MSEEIQGYTMRSQQFQEYIKKAKAIRVWTNCFIQGDDGTFLPLQKKEAKQMVEERPKNYTFNAIFNKSTGLLTIGSPE